MSIKTDVIILLRRAREVILLEEPDVHSQLIGDLKLMADKLEQMREVDPLAPISQPTTAE